MEKPLTRSRKLAIGVIIGTFLLSGFCAFKSLGSAASAIYCAGIPAGIALYASKQYNERKETESTNNLKVAKLNNATKK